MRPAANRSAISPRGVHVFPVRVYYEDTDAGGIVYHANYLKMAERARTEMLRAGEADHTRLAADYGVIFAVRRCEVDYLKPARLDDALEVRTRIAEIRHASVWVEQVIHRGEAALVRMKVQLVCVTPGGRAARFPAPVSAALRPFS
jgi:acyl-CoA thioester hydrolase